VYSLGPPLAVEETACGIDEYITAGLNNTAEAHKLCPCRHYHHRLLFILALA
jgi:hypothetical protein